MSRRRGLALILAVVALAVLVAWTQVGSLAYELIDHDEATFMVVAQSILRGHLPYLEAFDNKPPGLFYALAGTMWVFGQSLLATRLLGDLCILGSTLCLFACGRRYLPMWGAAALAAVFASAHLIKVAEYTSAEVVANLPMAVALLLLVSRRRSLGAAFGIGVMLSVATLIRTNLGIVAVAVGVLYLVAAWRPGFVGLGRWAVVPLALGGLLPVAGLVGVYAVQGAVPALFAAAVQVPLIYVGGGPGLAGVLLGLLDMLRQLVVLSPGSALLALGTVGAGALLVVRRARLASAVRADLLVVLVVLGATLLSIVVGGVFYQHYVLQLFPVATVLIGMAATVAEPRWIKAGTVIGGVFAAASLGLATPDNATAFGQLSRGEPYGLQRIAGEIEAARLPGERVWAIEHALILFYLDEPPLSPLASLPSMLFNRRVTEPLVAAGVVSGDEVGRVLAMAPAFIVLRTGDEVPDRLKPLLAARYGVFLERGEVTIFRRR